MPYQDLLFELGTEELPPKSLKKLSEILEQTMRQALVDAKLEFKSIKSYASPRRLAFVVSHLQSQQEDEKVERLGPAVAAAYNEEDGTPTQAALGFAKSCGVELDDLQTIETPKGKRLGYTFEQKGRSVSELVPDMLLKAIKSLPIPKMMRWGDSDVQFARPVHWVVLMYGSEVIPMTLLGKQTGNASRGHRFHSEGEIKITNASDYAVQLKREGNVIIDMEERKAMIVEQSQMAARKYLAEVVIDPDLLDEVNALIEYPQALCCEFPKEYLRVPQEALISSMKSHQKCFPLLNNGGKLINHFITVSNLKSSNYNLIVSGNQKVMNARLSDAAFFYDTDLKISLNDFSKRLEKVTFQQKLGTLSDKTNRVAKLASRIAEAMGASQSDAERAARFSKVDLMSNMVGEFPELQGVMGGYYTEAALENEVVVAAVREHYMPKFAGDNLPELPVSQAVALADKLDTLVGIFGIDMKPTGDKDPFALRRAAIGVIRILKEREIPLSVCEMVKWSIEIYRQDKLIERTHKDVVEFISDRLRNLYKDEQVNGSVFDAVASVAHASLLDFDQRIQAVRHFSGMPESESLSQANKRVTNLLQKNNIVDTLVVDSALLQESAEVNLVKAIQKCEAEVGAENDYQATLVKLAELEKPVNHFFEHVMIMADDMNIRRNRLAILQKLQSLFKRVADISKLAA